MFGFRGLAYIRDYEQDLQSRQHYSADIPANGDNKNVAYNSLKLLGEFKAKADEPKRGTIALDTESAGSNIVSPHLSSLSEILKSTQNTLSPFTETKHGQGKTQYLSIDNISWPSGCHSQQNAPLVSLPEAKSVTFSKGSLLTGNFYNQKQCLSSTYPRSRRIRQGYRYKTHARLPSYQNESSEQTSVGVHQRANAVGRLSPLQELNSDIGHSCVIDQQGLIVKKTRKPSKKVLCSSPRLQDNFCQTSTRSSGIKSFLSLRSSFTEDLQYPTSFLGRYRPASNPELRHSPLSSSIYQVHPKFRSASLNSLKHLQPDPKRRLYIGVKNPNLFLPSNRSQSFTTVTVTYRVTRHDERRVPTMAPNSITRLGEYVSNTGTMESGFTSPSVIRHNSSTDATAGSHATINGYNYGLATHGSEDSLSDHFYPPAPPNSPIVSATTGETGELLHMLNHNSIWALDDENQHSASITRNFGHTNLPMFNEGFRDSTATRRETGSDTLQTIQHELTAGVAHHNIYRCAGVCSPMLTDHDSDFACYHSGNVQGASSRSVANIEDALVATNHEEQASMNQGQCTAADPKTGRNRLASFGSEALSPAARVRASTRPKRAVSFAEGITGTPPNRLSVRTHNSGSSSGGILVMPARPPNPAIPPRLRGPSFSASFEENMLTLPMPPTDHVVPGGVWRRPTALADRSEKPEPSKGFFSKLACFASCFCSE